MSHTIDIKNIPSDLAGCGWYEILPEHPHFETLNENITTDWLIIGAGIAGLTAAKRLSELTTESITVIDAQKIAWSACGRNSGFMVDLPHELKSHDYSSARDQDIKQIEMNRAAIKFAQGIADEFQLQHAFKLCGKYQAATDGAGIQSLQTFSRHLDGMNESYQLLDKDEMQAVMGTDYYSAGMFTPGCAQIQPSAYILGIAQRLNQLSHVQVFQSSPALKIMADKTGHTIETPNGKIVAKKIILTVNGHIESFGFAQNRLMPIYTFASMTEPLNDNSDLSGQLEWGLTPAHPMGTSVRRILDSNNQSRILIRNTFTYNPSMKTDARQIAKLGKRHDRSFKQRFPHLAETKMQYRWGGHLTLSLNSAHVFGELQPNIYAACCQNGIGVTKGTLTGMLIADFATQTQNSMVDDMLEISSPTKLVPKPIMAMGAKPYLRWIHWRAGSDL